jgi:hypothetical protein
MATRTEGLMRAVYEVNLHTNPHPTPNDIVIYPTFKATRVAGTKHKYRDNYNPTFSD